MDSREYYVQQSAITDPGRHAVLFDDLPVDIQGLCSTVRGLVVHHLRGLAALGFAIPEDRYRELDTRHVSKMLDRIVELDVRPLQEPRPPERRVVGCCRDFAVLFCGMARHKGIPARVRYGFSTCPPDGFNYLHVVAECWHAMDRRWVLIDPELADWGLQAQESVADSSGGLKGEFISGARAWRAFREGKTDTRRFGRAPGTEPGGADALVRSSMLDLAGLNKEELLLWTGTRPEGEEFGESDKLLLDQGAKLAELVDDQFSELQGIGQRLPKLGSPPGRNRGTSRRGCRSYGASAEARRLQVQEGHGGESAAVCESGGRRSASKRSSGSGLRPEQNRRRGG